MAANESTSEFWRLFWRSEISAVASLLICATIIALYGFFDGLRTAGTQPKPLLSPMEAAKFAFLYSITIGLLPVILYGAPLYAAAKFFQFLSWKLVITIGLLPGLVIYFFGEHELGLWFIALGVGVSILTHLFSEKARRLG